MMRCLRLILLVMHFRLSLTLTTPLHRMNTRMALLRALHWMNWVAVSYFRCHRNKVFIFSGTCPLSTISGWLESDKGDSRMNILPNHPPPQRRGFSQTDNESTERERVDAFPRFGGTVEVENGKAAIWLVDWERIAGTTSTASSICSSARTIWNGNEQLLRTLPRGRSAGL